MVRLRVAVAALIAIGPLVGCDDEPEPNISDPTPSATTEPTESVSTSQSPIPELDPQATVRAWVNDWNAALASGDTTAVRAYEADECRGCDELIGPVEQIHAAGGEFVGGEWSIAEMTLDSGPETAVHVGVDVASGSTTPAAGASPSPYPASKHLINFKLIRDPSGRWRISVIEVVS